MCYFAASVEIILLLPLCWNKWGPRIDGIRCNKKWIRWRLMPTIIVNVMNSLLLKIIISQMSYNNEIIWPIDMAKNLYLGEFSIYKLSGAVFFKLFCTIWSANDKKCKNVSLKWCNSFDNGRWAPENVMQCCVVFSADSEKISRKLQCFTFCWSSTVVIIVSMSR